MVMKIAAPLSNQSAKASPVKAASAAAASAILAVVAARKETGLFMNPT